MAGVEGSMLHYLIGRARIKYSIMDDLFRPVFIPQDRVVMYIDASAILYRLYREKDLDMIYSVPKAVAVKDLVISFLNTIGHYRRYMMTRMHKTNDIVIFMDNKAPDYQTMIFPDYRKSWYHLAKGKNIDFDPLNDILYSAMEFIRSLIPYFEGIYLVDTDKTDTYTAIAHYMESNYYKDFFHIIFSRNLLVSQLVGPNCVQLYNKRDDSYLITFDSVYRNGVLKGRKTKAGDNMNAEMLPFIWTLGGCSDIDLKKSKYANGVADAVKILSPLVAQGYIKSDMSIQQFLKELSKHLPDGSIELRMAPEVMINRYRILNLRLCAASLSDNVKINLWKDHIDLYDQTGLEDINDRLTLLDTSEELLEITNLNMSSYYAEGEPDIGYGYSGGFSSFFNFSM